MRVYIRYLPRFLPLRYTGIPPPSKPGPGAARQCVPIVLPAISLCPLLFSALLFILGCGGSGSSSSKVSSSTPPPASTFTLSAGTPKVSLSAGGSPVTVSFAITGSAGFASTVQIVATGAPAGVTVSPVSISGAPNGDRICLNHRVFLCRAGNLYPDFHRNRFYAADAKRGGIIDHCGCCRTTAAAAVTQLLSEYYRAVSISAGRHGHCYLDGHLCWRI